MKLPRMTLPKSVNELLTTTWILAVEDDASRRVFDMIETDSSSASQAVELLASVDEEFDSPVPILEVITDHGSEFVNPCQDDRPCLDHDFERFLYDKDIEHTLCKVGRPQSNGKIERFFQTYEKHRWRFGTLEEFLTFYPTFDTPLVQFHPFPVECFDKQQNI